jgi:hypothetical protein
MGLFRHPTLNTGVTSNLYITDPAQKLPAADDNVQNHTQVTEVYAHRCNQPSISKAGSNIIAVSILCADVV